MPGRENEQGKVAGGVPTAPGARLWCLLALPCLRGAPFSLESAEHRLALSAPRDQMAVAISPSEQSCAAPHQ